jgi:GT2 family glycosyltransferase
MEKDLVSIIILNYNGKQFLENCINSIKLQTKKKYEIIVVDNASPDNSGRENAIKFPDCKFILNNENVGVPEGLNIGIRNSKGEFIILMNNDVTVTSNWLDGFFDAYNKLGIALYQPKFLKMKNPEILDGTGDMINIFGFGFARGKGQIDKMLYEEIEEVSYASGTCMFLPRKIIEDIGYFDQKLFAYHEELDFGWRARLFGYRSYYVPQSVIHHFGSAGWGWTSQKFYFLERNRWHVILKNYSFKTISKLLPSLIILEIFMIGFFTKKGILMKKLSGYGSIISSWNKIRKDRHEIQKMRKISDDEIMKNFCCNMYIPPESEEEGHMENFNKILIRLAKMNGYYKKVRIVE